MEYPRRFLDAAILKDRIAELGRLGLRSMMFAGEWEPFLHGDMAEIARHTKAQRIFFGTTNGPAFVLQLKNYGVASADQHGCGAEL
jgi:hypothetical protein